MAAWNPTNLAEVNEISVEAYDGEVCADDVEKLSRYGHSITKINVTYHSPLKGEYNLTPSRTLDDVIFEHCTDAITHIKIINNREHNSNLLGNRYFPNLTHLVLEGYVMNAFGLIKSNPNLSFLRVNVFRAAQTIDFVSKLMENSAINCKYLTLQFDICFPRMDEFGALIDSLAPQAKLFKHLEIRHVKNRPKVYFAFDGKMTIHTADDPPNLSKYPVHKASTATYIIEDFKKWSNFKLLKFYSKSGYQRVPEILNLFQSEKPEIVEFKLFTDDQFTSQMAFNIAQIFPGRSKLTFYYKGNDENASEEFINNFYADLRSKLNHISSPWKLTLDTNATLLYEEPKINFKGVAITLFQ